MISGDPASADHVSTTYEVDEEDQFQVKSFMTNIDSQVNAYPYFLPCGDLNIKFVKDEIAKMEDQN